MRTFIVDGITYEKIDGLDDNSYYCQKLFIEEELSGYLKTEKNKSGNMVESTKSPYDYAVIDSDIESAFAKGLEANENVIVYVKLPNWFKIPTPLGNYNPDWAVLVKPNLSDEEEKLYFIVETKGSLFEEDRRESENLKIECGKKHFKAIDDKIKFEVSNSFENFSKKY